MSLDVRVLIVEDHEIIITGYQYAINAVQKNKNYPYNYIYSQAIDCKTGYEAIINAVEPFDVVFLDLNMPPYPEKGIHNGEDLALLVKEKMPDCRILILSMSSDMDKILSFIDTVNPRGLIVKSDLDHKYLVRGFTKIMKDSFYYSDVIISLLRKTNIREGYEFDQYDDELIRQMLLGNRMRTLALFVPLTFEDVELRLRRIHHHFDNKSLDIPELLKILHKKKALPLDA